MSTVLETVTFRLAPQASQQHFISASQPTMDWVRQQPGFVYRTLSCDDQGVWSDHVLWQTLDQAQAASDAFMGVFANSEFMALIDPGSVQMQHLTVRAQA